MFRTMKKAYCFDGKKSHQRMNSQIGCYEVGLTAIDEVSYAPSISFRNQAMPNCDFRFTVACDMLVTSATSSMVNPPK